MRRLTQPRRKHISLKPPCCAPEERRRRKEKCEKQYEGDCSKASIEAGWAAHEGHSVGHKACYRESKCHSRAIRDEDLAEGWWLQEKEQK